MTLVEEAIIGRRRELELVDGFLTRDLGRAKALAIEGPPGIGKTTVWQAGVELARAAGRRLLVARPTGAEASLSYAGLVDLLTPVHDAFLSDLPSPQRRALAAALLRGEAPGGRVDRRAVGTATATVLVWSFRHAIARRNCAYGKVALAHASQGKPGRRSGGARRRCCAPHWSRGPTSPSPSRCTSSRVGAC
jgi:hypothetical protein